MQKLHLMFDQVAGSNVKGKHGLKRISEIPSNFWKQSLFSSICAKSIEYIYIYTQNCILCLFVCLRNPSKVRFPS